MPPACPSPGCYAPELPCQLGEDKHEQCKAWKQSRAAGSADETAEGTAVIGTEGLLLPWTGNSLGNVDVPFVAGRGSPTLVALVGPHNAGKTTTLAAWYLLLGRGQRLSHGLRFSGSYTLGGWENIAHCLRWEGAAGPTFPAHTPSGTGRRPGLLHLAFRSAGGVLQDVLCADAPGEWFRAWAIEQDAANAAGARWLAEHATVFLLTADSESLASASRGIARNDLKLLARRLGQERRGRPVALVWTKADVEVPADMRASVWDAIKMAVPDAIEFAVSAHGAWRADQLRADGDVSDGFLRLLDWCLRANMPPVEIRRRQLLSADPFLLYGAAR